MSSSLKKPWSSNPNAPQILYEQYFAEKVWLVGNLIGAIFYGIVIILFFQCMGALLNPIDRTRRDIKWGLVAHTAAMFLVLTLDAALSLDISSFSYVDNRGFRDTNRKIPPGPYGYQFSIYSDAISIIPNVMLFLNTCLADGFLIYRCYVIYSMNYWVIVLPCLMYLASLALSIATTYYQSLKMDAVAWNSIVTRLGVPYYSISVSLNILLTLMIATRLIRHSRNLRSSIGPATDGGLYNTVVTMLVESCALYAVASLLFIGTLGGQSKIQGVFAPIFVNIQVIAPFLIILRVANRTAWTSKSIPPGNIGSIHFKSRGESTVGHGTLHDGDLVSSTGTETNGEVTPGESNVIEEVSL